MKIIFYTTIALFIATSCNDKDNKQTNQDFAEQRSVKASGIEYKIVNETPNEALNKNNIDIELPSKTTREGLTVIANEIRSSRTKYNKLWIFYYLPGMAHGSGAWATTHFEPELSVNILGSTIEQSKQQKQLVDSIEGAIVGKWNEEQATSSSYILLNRSGKLFLKTIFKNGQSMEREMRKRKVNQYLERLDYIESMHGEYFLINKEGQLEFLNKNNKRFATGKPVK